MKNLPYTQIIIDKIIVKLSEEQSETKLPESAQGTEFQTGYDMAKKELIDKLKTLKID